jgi:hypothetical protein
MFKIRNDLSSTYTRYTVDVFPNYSRVHPTPSHYISVVGAVLPMVDTAPLLEPSFAEAITAVEAATDLSEQQRRHWVCSLRQVAKWLDRPVTTIPARWTSTRLSVERLHHVPLGVTAKTVANHKANVRAALRWFGKEHDVPARGVPLSPDWAKLRDDIGDRGRRARLYGLMR